MSSNRVPGARGGVLRRLLTNASYLLGSRVLRDAMGLVALALAARVLGPEAFGVLVLVQTYVMTLDWLVNFQSWQALVKYGSDLDAPGDGAAMKGLLRVSLALDGGSAVLGAAIGVAGAGLVGAWWGWSESTIACARLYSLVIVLNLSGTATGLLRLENRFGLLAVQGVVAAAIKLIGVLYAVAHELSLEAFILVWLLTDTAGYLAMLGCAAWVYRGRGYGRLRADAPGAVLERHRGIIRFFLTTNWHGTVRMASKEIDVLVVGVVLGSRAVGLFKVVKQMASILARVGDPLYQAVYPELARLWSADRRGEFRRLLDRSVWIGAAPAAASWLLFLALGRPAIALVLGDDYIGVFGVTLVYLMAVGISVATFAYHPSMLSMGRPGESFRILVGATVLYLCLLWPLIAWQELAGAAWAYLCFYLVWSLAMRFRLAVGLSSKESGSS